MPTQSNPTPRPDAIPLTLTINGEERRLAVEPWTSLLDLLRLDLGLTGTKKGCDHGQCGSCTVLIDGQRMNACLQLAVMQEGRAVSTIEGVARNGTLHALQQAFIEHDAFQCGYCTPGQIMSALALIAEHMSGNLCRCGAYPNIVAAIEDVMARRGHAVREAAE